MSKGRLICLNWRQVVIVIPSKITGWHGYNTQNENTFRAIPYLEGTMASVIYNSRRIEGGLYFRVMKMEGSKGYGWYLVQYLGSILTSEGKYVSLIPKVRDLPRFIAFIDVS